MKSKIYTLLFLSSLTLASIQQTFACGFYENEGDYQAMMFRAMLPDMAFMSPFFYTMGSTYSWTNGSYPLRTDPNETDRYRNCMEWLGQCDKSVSINDIYEIQYNTDARLYISATEKNTLKEVFANNTFIQFLVLGGNKDLLEYMLYAKEAEEKEIGSDSRFESWDDDIVNNYYSNYSDPTEDTSTLAILRRKAESKIEEVSSPFLKERYAFQLCRLGYQMNDNSMTIKVYDKYFPKIDSKSLMNVWACLFKAMAVDRRGDKSEANRLYCHVFAGCNEKKFRSVQMFNRGESVSDQYSDYEKGIAKTIIALREPARAIDLIAEVYALDKTNPYIPFLVLREINKLEDWMITPVFFNNYSISYSYTLHCNNINSSEDGEKAQSDQAILQAENLATDMQYLANLKLLIQGILASSRGETHDFYAMGLAHLSLLEENATDARKYLSLVSNDANPSILLQKNIESIWLSIKTEGVDSPKFEDTFVKNIKNLEKINSARYDNQQILYTLTLSIANEYLKKGDRVYGNLMHMHSERYRNDYWKYYHKQDSYYFMEYFDNNATTQDMDKLIAMIAKKNKSPMEAYLCNQHLNSIDAYKDLKGTIAFRNSNLELAYETFASMSQGYWQRGDLNYHTMLNEDPFIPKTLLKHDERKFDYKFNKTDFVKSLLDLQKTASAENYIKLGDAFFNTSYWGNSWMMTRYSWSMTEAYYSKNDCMPSWMNDYMTAAIAEKYYQKALAISTDDEQHAYTNMMLNGIYQTMYNIVPSEYNYIYEPKILKYNSAFAKLDHTHTYKKHRRKCAWLQDFIVSNAE